MKIVVQQGRVSHDMNLPDDSITKIEVLQDMIEKDLGIFKRKQKLIYKGKVLLAHHTVQQSKVQTTQFRAKQACLLCEFAQYETS